MPHSAIRNPQSALEYICPFEVLLRSDVPSDSQPVMRDFGGDSPEPCVALFVTDGFSDGRCFFTGYRKPAGSIKRLKRSALPCRTNAEDAEDDLREHAAKMGWFIHRLNRG